MQRVILSILAASLLAGCGDPLRKLPKYSEQELAAGPGSAQAMAGAEKGADAILPSAGAPTETEGEAPRGGLLGFLKGRADRAKHAAEPDETPTPPPASAASGNDPANDSSGLFGLLTGGADRPSDTPDPDAPDYREVGLGTTLPFGQMARLCGVPDRALGKKAGKWPERGRGHYTLYDSAPGSSGPRALFLTGFDDGCARQFTGALALFGAPEMHEQLRYGLPSKTIPYSRADDAYEDIKTRECRVARGKPCGKKVSRLKDTVFVTVYPSYGSSTYANMLLHDGEVAAFGG